MSSHIVSVILAALAMFALGAVWYSPLLFLKPWAAALGIDLANKPDKKAMLRRFAATLVLMLCAAVILDWIISDWAAGEGVSHGFTVGLLGGGIAGVVTGINYVFEGRSFKLFLINAGFDLLGFCAMGVVLALF